MLKGLFVMDSDRFETVYGPAEREDIAGLLDIQWPPKTKAELARDPSILHDVEVIMASWGTPIMDEAFLASAPKLKAVFYGGGSVKGITTEAFWQRGIAITSGYGANARAVAEYALSQILFCLKRGWYFALALTRDGRYIPRETEPAPGAYGSTVGVIALGMVGRRVCELLRPFDLKVVAHDPYATAETAEALGVELCDLDAVFQRADVITLHTPWLKTTEGMITGNHFASMKPYASFINTARGAIVREAEMIQVLRQRADLQAVLDVTDPEPPAPDSPLRILPNVVLTPHIAGSMFGECRRMGRFMVDELQRYLNGEPLHWRVAREMVATLA